MRMMAMIGMAAILMGSAAVARPALRDVPEIDNGMLFIGIADEIRKTCPSISARIFRALSAMRTLEARATDMGYSAQEIAAYVDSDAEKARMRVRADAYYEANGVTAGDPQSYCALGRVEIEKSSQIGTLLRAK